MKSILIIPLSLLLFAIPLHASDWPDPDPVPAMLASAARAAADYEAALRIEIEIQHEAATPYLVGVRAVEPGSIELAWLPIAPARARIELARNRVPDACVVSGYLRHAWRAADQHWRASVIHRLA